MQSKETNKTQPGKKTWKREVAGLLLLGLAYVIYTDDVEMTNAIVWPVMFFAAGAFGIDAAVKQLRK